MLGGKFTDHVVIGHSKGEGSGGECAPSHAKREVRSVKPKMLTTPLW